MATFLERPFPELLNRSVCANMYAPRSTYDGASLGTLYQRAPWQWFCKLPRTVLESHSWPKVNARCLKIKTLKNKNKPIRFTKVTDPCLKIQDSWGLFQNKYFYFIGYLWLLQKYTSPGFASLMLVEKWAMIWHRLQIFDYKNHIIKNLWLLICSKC